MFIGLELAVCGLWSFSFLVISSQTCSLRKMVVCEQNDRLITQLFVFFHVLLGSLGLVRCVF